MKKVTSQNLGLDHDYRVGIGINSVLVASRKNIMKYSFDGVNLKKTFQKALPEGMASYCRKYLLSNGHIVLRDYDDKDPTHIYDEDLKLLRSHNGDYGCLIGTPTDLLVYAKKISSSHCAHLQCWQQPPSSADTEASEGRELSWDLSVCRHPHTEYMAIVSSGSKTLDIYNEEGGFCYSSLYDIFFNYYSTKHTSKLFPIIDF